MNSMAEGNISLFYWDALRIEVLGSTHLLQSSRLLTIKANMNKNK